MIALFERDPVQSETAVVIAGALTAWLRDEQVISTYDRNSYLDDIEKGRNDLLAEISDPSNFAAGKHLSHENRQKIWGQGYSINPEDDFLAARQLFNITMGMSGAYKRMCFLRATDATSYLEMKLGDNPSGIDLIEAVEGRLRYYFGGEPTQVDLAKPVVDMETVLASTERAFKLAKHCLEFLHSRAPQDFDLHRSESLAMLEVCQGIWAEVAVDSILLAATNRNGALSRVPFLEAKSITDEPGVIYPFSSL